VRMLRSYRRSRQAWRQKAVQKKTEDRDYRRIGLREYGQSALLM
jgi:hypothetical protein